MTTDNEDEGRSATGMESGEVDSFLKFDDESSPSKSSSYPCLSSRPNNPYPASSFLSKMFFIWPGKLLKEGMLKTIEEKDLPGIMKEEESRHNREAFEKIWKDEVDRIECLKNKLPEGSKRRESLYPSLHRALVRDFFKTTWGVQPCMAASSFARVVMSIALGYLIQTLIDRSKEGYLWAGVVIISNAVVLFEHHHVFFITWRKGMQYRIGAISSIFSKSLRLNSVASTSSDSTSVGQTMNLVTNDVERFMMSTLFGSYIIWAPLQAIGILIAGVYIAGPAFSVGVGLLLFLFIPTQLFMSKRFAFVRSKVAAITDERMTLVSQAIEGVRVMKMSGWENELQNRVLNVRAREVKQIHHANRLKAINEVMFYVTYVIISMTVFIFHVFVFDGKLITRDVFTILSLISVLQLELTKHLALGVSACSECSVSISRIQKYLEAPELQDQISIAKDCTVDSDEVIVLDELTCYWKIMKETDSDSEVDIAGTVALDKINLSLKKNELTFVVGAVGSGKSALLYALAGELKSTLGCINRSHSSLAYASQNPWIMNGTVRMNILMGAPYDSVFYNEVVEACCLSRDFEQFRYGDQTIVGDRGVQCSGGQKARIGLARALYLDADVVLLDDPLSAVDSKVGRHIFYSAVQNLCVKKGKCVVLATHQHQYVGNFRCAHISNGSLKTLGSFEDCVKNSEGELHFVSNNAELKDKVVTENERKLSKVEEAEKATEGPKGDDQTETKFTGVVSKTTFVHYAKSMGSVWFSLGLFAIFLFASILNLSAVIVSGRWSELSSESQRSERILAIVLGLCGALIAFAFLQTMSSFRLTVEASKRLHNAMIAAVFRAKIEFFDTNPSGRILNRFSGDVGSNDDLLPMTLYDFFICAIHVSGALVVAIVALPFILVIMPPLIWYFLHVRRLFVNTSRELKRFEGVARSPIFSMLSESMSGISTIRPNGAEKFISNKFETCHDAHSRSFWSFLASSRWLGFRMDFLMFLNCSAACLLAVLFNEQGWFGVDPVILGLALSLLMQLGSIFQWTIRQSAEVVNQMVCVERVSEYSKIEAEAALEVEGEDDIGGVSWPENGSIEVRNLSVRYRDSLPLALDSVTFSVPSGKRLGVVGRTGCGKSTLVQALFRLLEADSGHIIIDDVDIKDLGLHKLRKGMSVINQYPVLFSGCTVRENLDPFNFFSDEQVIDALNDVQMMKAINDLPLGLNSPVAESGLNFSVGERQLLCLARAMLQKSKVLVLDEPTANVDGRTDKLLQDAVNRSFQGATIISVAHRLDTIIENDLILVLGNGKVLEYGSPSELISLNGHFTSMVNDTGNEMSNALKKRAMRNT